VRGRLLLVDDDAHVRMMLKAFLETRGYLVELAVNGRDALTRLGETDYDIVVSDYNMPEVDGLGVLRYVRQSWPSLPVVLMTGSASPPDDVHASMVLGAQACLIKPFDLQKLEQVLTEVLPQQSQLR